VRHARRRDLGRVTELWVELTRHHDGLDPIFELREGSEPEVRRLVDAMYGDVDTAILVYDEDGDLPGMCIVRIDHAPPILHETVRAEITDLGVRAAARRRGIGRALVAAATAWVRGRGVERIEVQVARGNREGQAFWSAAGYAAVMDVLHKRL